jgi:hypothetical protein
MKMYHLLVCPDTSTHYDNTHYHDTHYHSTHTLILSYPLRHRFLKLVVEETLVDPPLSSWGLQHTHTHTHKLEEEEGERR